MEQTILYLVPIALLAIDNSCYLFIPLLCPVYTMANVVLFQSLMFSVAIGALTMVLILYYVWFKKSKQGRTITLFTELDII